MRYLQLALAILATTLFSCQKKNDETVKKFISAVNKNDSTVVKSLIHNDFKHNNDGKIENKKDYFIGYFSDSLRIIRPLEILKVNDTIVSSREEVITIMDSLLGVKPNIIKLKRYKFKDGQIADIIVDTTLNKESNQKSYEELVLPFEFYLIMKYGEEEAIELVTKKLRKTLIEYTALSDSEKKKNYKSSHLQGVYTCKNSSWGYSRIKFSGQSTAVLYLYGVLPITTTYDIDGDYVRVKENNQYHLLRFKDKNTLVGENWVSGTYKKQKNEY